MIRMEGYRRSLYDRLAGGDGPDSLKSLYMKKLKAMVRV